MKNKKLWIFIGIIVLILILNHIFGWSSYLGNTENLKFLENMVQENLVLAIGIYTILTIISCVVLALPGVTFAIVAGLVFGPVLGTICCSVATTLGAMVAFVVGRFFLQDMEGTPLPEADSSFRFRIPQAFHKCLQPLLLPFLVLNMHSSSDKA